MVIHRRGSGKQGIRNLYARVALHLMGAEAVKHQLAFLPKFESDDQTTLTGKDAEGNPIPPEIRQAYSLVVRYAQGGIRHIDQAAAAALLQKLRRDYFHFSACWRRYGDVAQYAAHAPRMVDGKRERKIYPG